MIFLFFFRQIIIFLLILPKISNNNFLTFPSPSIFLSLIQAPLTLNLEPDPALK